MFKCHVTRVQSASRFMFPRFFWALGKVTNLFLFDNFVFRLRQDPQRGSSAWTHCSFTLGCIEEFFLKYIKECIDADRCSCVFRIRSEARDVSSITCDIWM